MTVWLDLCAPDPSPTTRQCGSVTPPSWSKRSPTPSSCSAGRRWSAEPVLDRQARVPRGT